MLVDDVADSLVLSVLPVLWWVLRLVRLVVVVEPVLDMLHRDVRQA